MFLFMTIDLKYKAGSRRHVASRHFIVMVTIQQYSTQAVTVIESILTLMFTFSDIKVDTSPVYDHHHHHLASLLGPIQDGHLLFREEKKMWS